VPESFLWPIKAMPAEGHRVKVLAEQPGVDPILPGGNAPPPVPPLISLNHAEPRADIPAGTQSGWWFGTTFGISQVELTLGQASDGQSVRIGVLQDGGAVAWQSTQNLGVGNTTVAVDLGGATGSGIVIEPVSGPDLKAVRLAVASTSGHYYMVEGALSDALNPKTWTQEGYADDFAVFKARFQPMATWLDETGGAPKGATPGDAPGTGTAQVVSSSTNSETIAVKANKAALLVWSMAWDAGWHASISVDGVQKSVSVNRVGIVQGVKVPAGSSLVSFSYRPPHSEMGAALTTATVLVLLACFVAWERRRRRNRALGASPDTAL
jgi:hypothetical protein